MSGLVAHNVSGLSSYLEVADEADNMAAGDPVYEISRSLWRMVQ
jgi:hypothetical protein